MREHVAKFTSAGQGFHLPPAEIARAPILQAARAVVIGVAEIALRDEVPQRLPSAKPGPGLRSPGSSGPAGGLFPWRDRLLVPDCDRALNSYRVSLRRPPAAADRGAGSGIAARLAISRGMSRFYRGSPRGF